VNPDDNSRAFCEECSAFLNEYGSSTDTYLRRYWIGRILCHIQTQESISGEITCCFLESVKSSFIVQMNVWDSSLSGETALAFWDQRQDQNREDLEFDNISNLLFEKDPTGALTLNTIDFIRVLKSLSEKSEHLPNASCPILNSASEPEIEMHSTVEKVEEEEVIFKRVSWFVKKAAQFTHHYLKETVGEAEKFYSLYRNRIQYVSYEKDLSSLFLMITKEDKSMLSATILVTYIERFLGDVLYSIKKCGKSKMNLHSESSSSSVSLDESKSNRFIEEENTSENDLEMIECPRMLKDLLRSPELKSAFFGNDMVSCVLLSLHCLCELFKEREC